MISPTFHFVFANAARVARIIRGLKNTPASGVDGIPTLVLKGGVEVLAGPVSHLINRSLADSKVPCGFKLGRVTPVYKGKGKARSDPASYRPINILPSLSKVLEQIVKEDLESHLQKIDGLPNSQFWFRAKKSTVTAISTAHASWIKASQKGKTVGVLSFDLSSAFDTIDPEQQLLGALDSIGVRGKQAKWFRSYMEGGQQCVV